MLTAIVKSLITPHYPRRYVGRHRPRYVSRTVRTARVTSPATVD